MKTLKIVCVAMLFCLLGFNTMAQKMKNGNTGVTGGYLDHRPPTKEKMLTRRVLKKTAFIIHIAHQKVKENKNYTGDLAKAVKHQQFAKKLYMVSRYKRAMHHSRTARKYAILALKANKGEDSADFKLTPEEETILKSETPSDIELNKELEKEMPELKKITEGNLIKENGVEEVDVE